MDFLDDDDGLQEDFYAILNVSRDATIEQITRAFRKLSLLYHPDRHGGAIERQSSTNLDDKSGERKGSENGGTQAHALAAFHRLQRAFDVLSDAHKRAIYDTLGEKGLQVSGWELVPQIYSPHQIRDEFERLKKQAEMDREAQRTNPTGSFQIRLNATDLMRPETEEEIESGFSTREFPYIEISSFSMEQSIEAPMGQSQRVIVGGNVKALNGRGLCCTLSESEGTSLACKITRTFSKKMYGAFEPYVTVNWSAYSWRDYLVPGIELSVTRQLDRHLSGKIATRLGGASQNFVTTLIYDDQSKWQVVTGLVLGTSSFLTLSSAYRCASLLSVTESDYGDISAADSSGCLINGGVKVGTMGLILDGGFETQVTSYSRFGCSALLFAPTGGLRVKLRWRRGGHWYEIDTTLCDNMDYLPSSVILGVCAPAILFWMGAKIARPYLDKWFINGDENDWQARAKLVKDETERRREQALQAVELMRDTAVRIRQREENKSGLVIVQAQYGQLAGSPADYQFRAQYGASVERVIDVTVQLQSLVSDSKLLLTDSSKAQLPGFYDPAVGSEKSLMIRYSFQNQEHLVIAKDTESVCIPNRCWFEMFFSAA